MIDSIADTGSRIYAVILSAGACPECRHDGEEFYALTNPGRYRHVYFQDRDQDIFLVK
jgi:hypothetical protein